MKVAKFAFVGVIGFLFDAAFFYLFIQLTAEPMVARLFAFWLAATCTWLGNKHLTFRCTLKTNLFQQWGKHMLSAHLSGTVNLALFYLVSTVQPLQVAFVIGIVAGACFNYVLSDRFVFIEANERG